MIAPGTDPLASAFMRRAFGVCSPGPVLRRRRPYAPPTITTIASYDLRVRPTEPDAPPERWAKRSYKRRCDAPKVAGLYFVQVGIVGAIKIGRASNIHTRVGDLQSANAEPLRLLGIIRGCDGLSELERETHSRFRGDWIAGEWFRPSRALLDFVQLRAESWA